MNKEIETEVLVLGAGPSGYSAAFRCADLGLHTTIVNQYYDLGGICLNVGCIPSKTLLHFSKIINEMNFLKNHGLKYDNFTIDINKIRDWKETVIRKLTNNLNNIAKIRQLKIIYGIGKFIDNKSIYVQNKDKLIKIKFNHAIIASGSRNINLPFISKINDRIWDSTDALKLKYIPQKILVIGGGIIGLEISTIYQSLGSTIDIVETLDQVIEQADKDIVNMFYKCINNKINFLLNTKVIKVDEKGKDFCVTLQNKQSTLEKKIYDTILIAVGRMPNSDLLNIDQLGIKKDHNGYIIVDKQMRTNISNIYAIGDVAGQPMLAHKGTYEGHIAAEVISGKKHYFEPKVIPYIAYTNPEISWVGITEKIAISKDINYKVVIFPWTASGRAISSNYLGMTKLIFDIDTRRIIGGAIVGNNADELIGEITLAIEMSCYAEDIALTIHAHPTLYESIGLSAEIFTGSITDLLNLKKNKI